MKTLRSARHFFNASKSFGRSTNVDKRLASASQGRKYDFRSRRPDVSVSNITPCPPNETRSISRSPSFPVSFRSSRSILSAVGANGSRISSPFSNVVKTMFSGENPACFSSAAAKSRASLTQHPSANRSDGASRRNRTASAESGSVVKIGCSSQYASFAALVGKFENSSTPIINANRRSAGTAFIPFDALSSPARNIVPNSPTQAAAIPPTSILSSFRYPFTQTRPAANGSDVKRAAEKNSRNKIAARRFRTR